MTTYPEPRGARTRQSYYWQVRNQRSRTRPVRGVHACETWHILHGHPGGAYSDFGHDPTPPEHHTPTLLTRRTYGQDDDQYRGGCLACDWEGDVPPGPGHAACNAAIADAHDHAFPGWRALPITPHRGEAWDLPRNQLLWAQIAAGYPRGWAEAGAPLVVWSRHRMEPHQPPHRRRPRYELRVPKPSRQASPAEQAELF
ncbi:DUF6349 family protein [Streptomyces sp. NPDC050610]|uniref:DUF6349 family protein n=1 Tax=Streptomyces sp. NPDC050610 TaxID=3157097 RepID=UPI00342F183E